MLDQVLTAYGFNEDIQVLPHGSGLINRTWLVRSQRGDFILQQINQDVFSQPYLITENIDKVSSYLASHYPGTIFPKPVATTKGEMMVEVGGAFASPLSLYRKFRYDRLLADTPSQAVRGGKNSSADLRGMLFRLLRQQTARNPAGFS